MLLFTCDVGFTLVGAVVRKCQANGTWSGTDALCQGEKKLSFMSKLNHHDSPLKHEYMNLPYIYYFLFSITLLELFGFFYLVSLFLGLLFYFCCNFRCSDGTILINVSIVVLYLCCCTCHYCDMLRKCRSRDFPFIRERYGKNAWKQRILFF